MTTRPGYDLEEMVDSIEVSEDLLERAEMLTRGDAGESLRILSNSSDDRSWLAAGMPIEPGVPEIQKKNSVKIS